MEANSGDSPWSALIVICVLYFVIVINMHGICFQWSAYLHKTGEYSGATKEETEGDDDVGEKSKNQDDDVRLPPIAGLDHLNMYFKCNSPIERTQKTRAKDTRAKIWVFPHRDLNRVLKLFLSFGDDKR